jgi:hypothetical protein
MKEGVANLEWRLRKEWTIEREANEEVEENIEGRSAS